MSSSCRPREAPNELQEALGEPMGPGRPRMSSGRPQEAVEAQNVPPGVLGGPEGAPGDPGGPE